ncbi:MAG TPA: hypothetical protein VFX03_00125, partial [Thermomicrobiales bacterium]|nr:hypothetical protein [Thermomicrobiales bacterium]
MDVPADALATRGAAVEHVPAGAAGVGGQIAVDGNRSGGVGEDVDVSAIAVAGDAVAVAEIVVARADCRQVRVAEIDGAAVRGLDVRASAERVAAVPFDRPAAAGIGDEAGQSADGDGAAVRLDRGRSAEAGRAPVAVACDVELRIAVDVD